MSFTKDITPEMLRDQFRNTINPDGEYHDVERFLQARWRRMRKAGVSPDEREAIQVMITDCRGARAMIAAHRAGMPKTPWPA